MAKTGAERQAAYRARQLVEESGQRRISTWISKDAALALEKMAESYGVTMRVALEMLLLGEREVRSNTLKENKFLLGRQPRAKRLLPGNDPSAAPALPDPAPDSMLPRNEKGAEKSEKSSPAAEPSRGQQYSLEL